MLSTIAKRRIRWGFAVAAAIVILGIYFRFAQIDRLVYWHDEVYTALHLRGLFAREWQDRFFQGQIVEARDIQTYLIQTPQKSLAQTAAVLARDDPHHPPLYYFLVHFWVEDWGNSVAALRYFSAIASLLTLPLMLWLGWELFGSLLAGWVAMGIVALSPVFILYAQEAREYALWTGLILFNCTMLLRGMRLTSAKGISNRDRWLHWLGYAVSLAIAFYTSLFTLHVFLGQAAYAIAGSRFRLTPALRAWGVAATAAIASFLPWILALVANYDTYVNSTAWAKLIRLPRPDLLHQWGLNFSRIVWDGENRVVDPLANFAIAFSLLLAIAAFIVLCRQTSPRIWGFILCLGLPPIALLLVPDLLWGGVRSLSPRYLIPLFIAVYLALAAWIDRCLRVPKGWQRALGRGLVAGLVVLAIASNSLNLQRETSWSKSISYSLPAVAAIVNAAPRPLIVGNAQGYQSGNLLALTYRLRPDVRLQLLGSDRDYRIPDGFDTIFLLSPTPAVLDAYRADWEMRSRLRDDHLQLWQATPRKN